VARGLEYLHILEPPIVHGDLKGANVLIDDQGLPKLGDFGLAKALEGDPTGLTTSTAFQGSIRWLATELLFDKPRSKESDIWAFGYLALEVRSYLIHILRRS